MARVAVPGETQGLLTHNHHFTFFERYVLRRVHPRSLFIESTGLIWFSYFIWYQNWGAALVSLLLFRAAAIAAVWNVSPKNLSETYLGRVALLHLHPMNVAVQLAGLIIYVFGMWQHAGDLILVGLSIVLLGHLFGWSKVDARFADSPSPS